MVQEALLKVVAQGSKLLPCCSYNTIVTTSEIPTSQSHHRGIKGSKDCSRGIMTNPQNGEIASLISTDRTSHVGLAWYKETWIILLSYVLAEGNGLVNI